MKTAHVKFGVFVALVLALPAGLMATGDPDLIDLGKLAMILSPGFAGLVLNGGFRAVAARPRWIWVAIAMAVTLAVAVGALAITAAFGLATFRSGEASANAIALAVGASALTSVLEELGWAAGGLGLAVTAFGRRWGVPVLGLVWAAWHLIPAFLRVGLFPDLEAGPPGMIFAFVVSCLIYRELLTLLCERAGSWLAAAAGHAAPNILLAGLMAAGLSGFHRPDAWMLFPAPGGLVFPALALIAVFALQRRRR